MACGWWASGRAGLASSRVGSWGLVFAVGSGGRPDPLVALDVGLEPLAVYPAQAEDGGVGGEKSVGVDVDEHLVVEPVDRVVQRRVVQPYLGDVEQRPVVREHGG